MSSRLTPLGGGWRFPWAAVRREGSKTLSHWYFSTLCCYLLPTCDEDAGVDLTRLCALVLFLISSNLPTKDH